MKRIPLNRKIKRRRHIEITKLQDMLIEALYRTFPKSVLHEGTAIWRCYSGNRFSEDVDVYIDKNIGRINALFRELKVMGFVITKKRIKENSLYSTLRFNKTEIRFEAIFKKVKGVLKEYETYEGILLTVYTLLPEEIIMEKVDAYLKRRKIRDLYDIFFLLRYVEEPYRIKSKLEKLMRDFEEPVDERELKVLILFGAVPGKEEMLDYIKRWLREAH